MALLPGLQRRLADAGQQPVQLAGIETVIAIGIDRQQVVHQPLLAIPQAPQPQHHLAELPGVDAAIAVEIDGRQHSRQIVMADIHTGFNANINDGDWLASDFNLNEVEHSYSTNFGKPSSKFGGKGVYSRIRVEITLHRARITSFLKLCAGVYAAVIIAGMAFLMDVREPDIVSGRTGLLVGCLFAALVNMQQAEATLGMSEDVTLTDLIHIISIAYILSASLQAMASYLRCEAGRENLAQHIDRKICLPIYMSSFVVVNAVVIAYAAIIG